MLRKPPLPPTTPAKKFCKKCQTTKSVDAFYRNRSAKDNLSSYCGVCERGRWLNWDVKKQESQWQSWYSHPPNITLAEFKRANVVARFCYTVGILFIRLYFRIRTEEVER